jgi:hypothetical protein
MAKKITESIDRELAQLKARGEYGGAKASQLCDLLEGVMRDLKVFDQRRHKCEQLEEDLNARFEAIVLSLDKITKILKDNGLLVPYRD